MAGGSASAWHRPGGSHRVTPCRWSTRPAGRSSCQGTGGGRGHPLFEVPTAGAGHQGGEGLDAGGEGG